VTASKAGLAAVSKAGGYGIETRTKKRGVEKQLSLHRGYSTAIQAITSGGWSVETLSENRGPEEDRAEGAYSDSSSSQQQNRNPSPNLDPNQSN